MVMMDSFTLIVLALHGTAALRAFDCLLSATELIVVVIRGRLYAHFEPSMRRTMHARAHGRFLYVNCIYHVRASCDYL
jgi:hypothetical protein